MAHPVEMKHQCEVYLIKSYNGLHRRSTGLGEDAAGVSESACSNIQSVGRLTDVILRLGFARMQLTLDVQIPSSFSGSDGEAVFIGERLCRSCVGRCHVTAVDAPLLFHRHGGGSDGRKARRDGGRGAQAPGSDSQSASRTALCSLVMSTTPPHACQSHK
jgi:hypothetical protein